MNNTNGVNDMREKFEAWAEKELLPLDMRDSNHYRYNLTNRAWAGWQASLAAQVNASEQQVQPQDHFPAVRNMVAAVNALAAQTGESPESITEWLTDKGGLTQLMLSHFGGISAQVQQPVGLNDFIQKHVYVDGKDSWTYNSLSSSAQDFIDSAVSAFASQVQQEPAGWQRRLKFSVNGQVHQWELCTTNEATVSFGRSPFHEYRQIFTMLPPAPEGGE